MTLALLCSGQGPQHAGMFAMTGAAVEAAPLFDHARTLLDGRDPRELVRVAAPGALHRNRTGQILCTLQALAGAAALADVLPRERILAGYSIGELAAWGVAGLFEPASTLDLAARRAEVMDGASRPGDGLVFVRGLGPAAIDALCRDTGAALAIVNPGDGVVLGGNAEVVAALPDAAMRAGAAHVVRIAVDVASHTPRLSAAAAAFQAVLAGASVAPRLPSGLRLLSGIDAAPVLAVERGRTKLARQIATTIDWAGCLSAAAEAGASAFLEFGPGRALAEMAAQAHPGIPARALEDFRTIDGVRGWLARTMAR